MIIRKNQHAFIPYILVILSLVILILGCQKSGTNPTNPNVNAPVNSNTNNGIPSENSPSLQGNVPFNLIVAEKENVSYFLSHDGDRSGYLVDTGLYRLGINESAAVRLAIGQIKYPQTAGDYVYYLMDKKILCRINAQDSNSNQEVVLEGVTLYSLYDHWAYYWNKSDSSLYRMDLVGTEATPQKIAGFADLDSLTARGDFILAIEREAVRDSQKVVTTAKVWKLSVDGSKKDLLMSDEFYKISCIQPYQDQIYYMEDNIIWRINIVGENKEKVYTPDGSDINSFIVNNNRIYIEERTHTDPHIFVSVNLEGKDKRPIFTYRSPVDTRGSAVNGTMDKMHIFGFDVTRDYLILTGASYYHGEILTTRLPIAGDAEGKKEEVFFNGAWRSIEDYVEEIHRVQASKGLKP